jgi:ribonuclease HI
MWVTCYADASFHPGQGGAWGVWLRSDAGRLVRHGACPAYVHDATVAELSAIFAGVYLALRTWGERVRGVSVRSDSQNALALADANSPLARREHVRRLQLKLRLLLEEARVELDCKWVRGHQPAGAGTSAYLNRRCDKLARRARKANARRAGVSSGRIELP